MEQGPSLTPPRTAPRRRRRGAAADGWSWARLIWSAFGWIVFWLAVTVIDHAWPESVRATAPRAVVLAPHPLTGYFNDEAQVFALGDVERYNRMLAQFEKDTSNQIAVALFPDAPDGALEDFTIKTADLSRLGRKGLDNGAILFVFEKPRLARLEVGYGLESLVNDGKAGNRLDTAFVPAWQRGETVQAMDATLAALFADVHDAYAGGKMPGPIRLFARKLRVEIPKVAAGVWPEIRSMPMGARIGITFFGSLLALGFIDGFTQAFRLVRNVVRGAGNLLGRRPLTTGLEPVPIDSMLDVIKLIAFVGFFTAAAVGAVVISGGGAFGGGGAMRHW